MQSPAPSSQSHQLHVQFMNENTNSGFADISMQVDSDAHERVAHGESLRPNYNHPFDKAKRHQTRIELKLSRERHEAQRKQRKLAQRRGREAEAMIVELQNLVKKASLKEEEAITLAADMRLKLMRDGIASEGEDEPDEFSDRLDDEVEGDDGSGDEQKRFDLEILEQESVVADFGSDT
ncbi:hypothetical protein BDN72DRAFT_846203, partial [Pluteus cervinus]